LNVLLGVTGSVAAIRTPELYQALRQAGHQVKIVSTRAALYFFDPAGIDPVNPGRLERNREVVILDEDEWPGQGSGRRYERDHPVLHIELRRWADLLLIAPLDANTLAKLAHGLADNCLTCVWRAWDPHRPVILAPAMNTLMWEHPMTPQHLLTIAGFAQSGINNEEREMIQTHAPSQTSEISITSEVSTFLDYLMNWINQNYSKLRIVPPVNKRLACGDVGVGAMAAVQEIVNAVCAMSKSGK
jgi:phosphopantothenoylcysteine decarboxylase